MIEIRHKDTGAVLLRVEADTLEGADLSGSNLEGAMLWGANLTGANLARAVLKHASLTGALLGGADLRAARLKGADLTGALLEGVMLRDADLRGPLVLVVGSEGQGLGPAVRRRSDLLVRIPMRGVIGSLNAAVAGSILLYEALAQRRDPSEERSAQPVTQKRKARAQGGLAMKPPRGTPAETPESPTPAPESPTPAPESPTPARDGGDLLP